MGEFKRNKTGPHGRAAFHAKSKRSDGRGGGGRAKAAPRALPGLGRAAFDKASAPGVLHGPGKHSGASAA